LRDEALGEGFIFMKLKRITQADYVRNQFYQLPKFLFTEQFKNLSNDARVLYAFLNDRFELSMSNGWQNEKGEIFLLYARENMCKDLGLSDNTVRKAIKHLEAHGLMSQERQGQGKPNKIFLGTVKELKIRNINQTFKYCGSEPSKGEELNPQDLPPNKTNINQTEFNETEIQGEKVIRAVFGENSSTDFSFDNYFPPEIKQEQSIFERITNEHKKEWADWALGIVNHYIDKTYPAMAKREHPQIKSLTKARRLAFAEKILDCMDGTEVNKRNEMIEAMQHLIDNRHPNTDPTIFWLTDPKKLGYGILNTHELGWQAVEGTDYVPVEAWYG
jgi:hypothetical protein